MSLDRAHFVANWLAGAGVRGYHLRVHSSGIDVAWPAGIHMDDANAKAAQIRNRIGRIDSAFLEIDWHPYGSERVPVARSIRHPPTVRRLEQVRDSAMLRFRDESVAFVSVQRFVEHAHGPFVQRSTDRTWRCEACGKKALQRDLRGAGVRL